MTQKHDCEHSMGYKLYHFSWGAVGLTVIMGVFVLLTSVFTPVLAGPAAMVEMYVLLRLWEAPDIWLGQLNRLAGSVVVAISAFMVIIGPLDEGSAFFIGSLLVISVFIIVALSASCEDCDSTQTSEKCVT